MKIGILGSGSVGKTLASGFIKHGYEVMIGTQHKDKLSDWSKGKKVQVGTFSETAKFGDIIVLAVKGLGAKDTLKVSGKENLGKIIIDTTNPIANAPPVNGVLRYYTTLDESLMEQLQKEFPKARFVKAFNSIGNELMVNPDFDGVKPTMFICGNDVEAKLVVINILEKFGFEPEDMGMAEAARVIEPLCILWCIPVFLRNDRLHAFRMLKKS